MQKTALVTGADRGLGFALVEGLLARGWRVFAGQHQPDWPQLAELQGRFAEALVVVALDVGSLESVQAAEKIVAAATEHLDLLINNAGISSGSAQGTIREGQDYAEMHRMYDVNALGPLRMVEAFLPLLELGDLKRLCFVSSEASSIERSMRTSWYGYCMSKTALNMATKIMFNDLRPEGFQFRLYHPGWLRTYMSGSKATEGDMEADEAAVPALDYFLASRDDEDRLALRDWRGQEWPW